MVNPFAFLLAKRFVDYEFVGIDDEPSDSQFINFVYDRYKRKGYEQTSYSDTPKKRDSTAYSIAESLRKNLLLKRKTFQFTEKMLDRLISEIKIMPYEFKSWNHFIKHIQDHPAFISAEMKLHQKKTFADKDIKQFLAYANKELYIHHVFLSHIDSKNIPSFVFYKETFVTRSANKEEIQLFEKANTEVGLLPSNLFLSFKSYLFNHRFNSSTLFFVHKDEFDNNLAHFLLLPLTDLSFKNTRNGKQFINFFSTADIVPENKSADIRHFYFYLITSTELTSLPQALESLEIGFKILLSKLQQRFGDLSLGIRAETDNFISTIKALGFANQTGDDLGFYTINWTEQDTINYVYKALDLCFISPFDFNMADIIPLDYAPF